MDTLFIIWSVMIVAFIIIEALTITFFPICFAISAIPALIFNVFGFGLIWQLVAFAITLMLCLYFLIPFLRKIAKVRLVDPDKIVKTNLDMIIGTTGVCLEPITFTNDGVVKVGGKEWTAKVNKNIKIKENDLVVVEQIQGSKIIVKKKEEK